MSELRPFSYVVMALVGRDGAGPHDMVSMMRRGRIYWSAAESHWYAEPKRLAGLGYLRAESRPGRTTERTHYTLTDRGLAALRDWLGRPSGYPRVQDEAVVRVLASDLGDPAAVARSMEGLRREIDELAAGIDASEALTPSLAHRERALRLVQALGRDMLRVHREWAERVERELGGP